MSDLIDRQAAIDAINTWDRFGVDGQCRIVKWHEGLEPYVHLRDVVTAIVNLPSAQRWIPCSEQMPKVREWVLCQCRAGIMDVLRLIENGDWNKNYPHAEYMSGFVIAWMPLPEPYKEDNDDATGSD